MSDLTYSRDVDAIKQSIDDFAWGDQNPADVTRSAHGNRVSAETVARRRSAVLTALAANAVNR